LYTCRCSKRPPTDSKMTSHLSQRQIPLSVTCGLSFSGVRAGNRIVVGAERIGDGFDSLPRESSSSTSSSSTGADWPSSSLLSSFDGDNLVIGESWPLCDLNAPRILPQLFVRLLFSFTCGFAKIALKSNGSPSNDETVVAGGELPLVELIFASEVNLYQK